MRETGVLPVCLLGVSESSRNLPWADEMGKKLYYRFRKVCGWK